jgi:signal transduction histidine kinase
MPVHRQPLVLSRATVPLLIGLVAAVVGVSGVLAYEAYRARHTLRVTAERALGQYASMAAWELDAAVRSRVDRTLQDLFAPVLGGVAMSPYDRLPAEELLLPRASALGIACGGAAVSALRLALTGDRVTEAGTPLDGVTRRAITDGVRQSLRSTSAAETRFLLPLPHLGEHAFAAVGVRSARFGVPLAAYAVPDCRGALLRGSVAAVLREHALLPGNVRGSMPNDSVLGIQLHGPGGEVIWRSGGGGQIAATQPLRAFPGIAARVALRPASLGALLVAPPERSRLPLLVGVLALCVVLALVALVQLRREHELAHLRADFTSSISHELRTPLAQILLFGETLSLRRARTAADQEFAAASIVREARRLMNMVDNVLHFSRSRANGDVRLEPIALAPYLEEVVASFAPLAAAAGMRIETHVDGAAVLADAAMLRQVVLNLLDNAVKYGRPGQCIEIAGHAAPGSGGSGGAGEGVRLTVSDDGPGIAPSDRERVWMPYVRLHTQASGRRTGSGIGLAVVRELVTAMGGRAWVEAAGSESGQHGARFVVELPAATPVST